MLAMDECTPAQRAWKKSKPAEETARYLYGVKSPTPETESVHELYQRTQREDEELELALELSLVQTHTPPRSRRHTLPRRSQVPFAFHLPYNMVALSVPCLRRPICPSVSRLLLLPPNPALKPSVELTLLPPLVYHLAQGATPVIPRKRRPAPSVQKRLNITTQLNQDWMAAAAGPKVIPSSKAIPAASSTFHTARTVSRRPFADTREVNRFTAVFMDTPVFIDGEPQPPVVISVDDCPDFPEYVFDKPILGRLGIDEENLEMFHSPHGTFMGIASSYVHTVTTDGVVMLRRTGLSPAPTPSSYGQYNIYGTFVVVVLGLSIYALDQHTPDPIDPSIKRTSFPEPGPAEMASWAVCVRACSRVVLMRDPAYKSLPRIHRFALAFGPQHAYVQGTYNENAGYWASATPALREEAIAAGRTADGLWSQFRKRVRALQESL
ncbi:hypothetical protein B0H13DRAFT_2326662 [Mycena leptocephala]|nr:hypothetical protein B0H13DRAFT_2326662 [Mycena leptocephala]